MTKKIPQQVEKLGKIWVLINQGHHEDSALGDKKYKKARSLLWELVGRNGGIWINSKVIVLNEDMIDTESINTIKGSIHKRIRDEFDEKLYDSMVNAEHYNWKWDRIVDSYKGNPLTENDKQYDIWHDLKCTVRAVGKQISFNVYKKKYKNEDEIVDQLQSNLDFIRKRMIMLQQ